MHFICQTESEWVIPHYKDAQFRLGLDHSTRKDTCRALHTSLHGLALLNTHTPWSSRAVNTAHVLAIPRRSSTQLSASCLYIFPWRTGRFSLMECGAILQFISTITISYRKYLSSQEIVSWCGWNSILMNLSANTVDKSRRRILVCCTHVCSTSVLGNTCYGINRNAFELISCGVSH